MANQIPVKAIYSGSDVTSLGEFTASDDITITYLPVGTGSTDVAAGDHTHAYLPLAGGTMTGNLVMGANLVDGIDISARDAVLSSTATTASAALPKAGGAMTGAITTNSTFDGVDVDACNTLAVAALPKSGGAMTGAITTNSTFDGVDIATRDAILTSTTTTAAAALPKAGGTMTGAVKGSTDTDTSNSGSITLDFATNQNFVLTLTGNVTLANPSTEVVGQSGFIAFIQDGTGSRTVALGTDYETAAAAGLTLTATASATDLVPYLVVASNRVLLGTPQLAFA